jgi:hypothetical protein
MIATSMGLVIGLGLLGALLAKLVLGRCHWLECLGLGYPLGAGTFSWLVFLLSLLGMDLTPLSFGLTLGLVIAGLLLGVNLRGAGAARPGMVHASPGRGEVRSSPMTTATFGAIAVLLVGSVALAVGRSYSSYDAAAGWAVKGYGIALEGSIEAADRWGMWGRAYPLNLSLQVAAFESLGLEGLPGSMLIPPAIHYSALLGILCFWRRHGVDWRLVGAGLLVLASNPLVFLHSTLGLANLPLGAYLTLGTLWLADGVCANNSRFRWMGGILLALACWTRAEGVAYILALLLAVLLARWVTHQGVLGTPTWTAPIALVVVSWFGFSWGGVSDSHLGGAMGGFVQRFLSGQFNARYLIEILKLCLSRGIQPSNLGLLFPAVALLLGLGLWKFRPRRQALETVLLSASGAAAAMPVIFFYVRSFTRWADFTELLIRSFDRATLPAIFMIMATSVLLFNSGWNASPAGPVVDRTGSDRAATQ